MQKNPEKNGALGDVISFNKEKGRWLVEFSNGTSNNFKEENLEVTAKIEADDDKDEEIPTAKLYITNLAAEVEEKDLVDLFSRIGVLAKAPVRDKRGNKQGFEDQWPYAVKIYKPGRRGGDGSVEYVDKFAAKAGIKSLNGYTFKGSKIGVSYAGQGKTYAKTELRMSWAEKEYLGLNEKSGGRE